MSVSDFQSLYLSEQPLVWMALAAMLGMFIGVRIGRALERVRASRKASVVEVPAGSEEASKAADEDSIAADASDGIATTASDGFDIRHLVGINNKQIKALSAHGILSVAQLRDATATKGARENMADELQLEDFVVNKWARMADFLSLDDMTPEVAEFLVFAGINSTKDLASRNPESVAHKLQNLNEKESRIEAVPSRQQLEVWVAALNA